MADELSILLCQEIRDLKQNQPLRFLAIAAVAALLGTGSLSSAQENVAINTGKLTFKQVSFTPSTDDGQGQSPGTTTSSNASAAAGDGWHFVIAPYLWLAGIHGTAGTASREVAVHASAGDMLSHFRFGLMGLLEADHKRIVLPLDIMWARLGDNQALPFPNLPSTSAELKIDEFILTPKVGYRLLDQEKLKIDALTGFRYWHLGQNLQFSPSRLGLNFSTSQNWVDPLVGGRILGTLTPKVSVAIGGDVGGWGAGSQLDYQIYGILGYVINPRWALQAGWRYLDVNYRSNTVFDCAMSGVVIGVKINLK
jgi:hypothetical protein